MKTIPEPNRTGAKIKSRASETDKLVRIPLVSMGPSGIGGEYQWETVG